MSDPLSLVPFALAARQGVIDGWPVRQLVAAGVSLLRGSAPLVRDLAGKRSAILLPPGPLLYTALAASEGRSAGLLDPHASAEATRDAIAAWNVGAVYTTAALEPLLAPEVPRVLLDDAPRSAQYAVRDRRIVIDLSMHEGVALEGDPDADGSNEEVMVARREWTDEAYTFTHRALLARARSSIAAAGLLQSDHVFVMRGASDVEALASGDVAALLAGSQVTTADPRQMDRSLEVLEALDASLEPIDVSVIAATPLAFALLTGSLVRRRFGLEASPRLRAWLCLGPKLSDAATAELQAITGRALPMVAAPGPGDGETRA